MKTSYSESVQFPVWTRQRREDCACRVFRQKTRRSVPIGGINRVPLFLRHRAALPKQPGPFITGCRQQRKIFAITGRKQRFVHAALLVSIAACQTLQMA